VKGKWEHVTTEHVLKAISKYDSFNTGGYARNTFLKYDGRLYPAKRTRGLAYEAALNGSSATIRSPGMHLTPVSAIGMVMYT